MTLTGNRYFLLLMDDMSCYMCLSRLASKDLALAVIKQFQAMVDIGCKLKVLRASHDGEFT